MESLARLDQASNDHMIAIRCDGGQQVGAGHVARCVPVASALRRRGAGVQFVGNITGMAAWLLARHGFDANAPGDAPLLGLQTSRFEAAVVDVYAGPGASTSEICGLAAELPIATPGEALRCPTSGTWINYHLDAPDRESPRELAGARFVPVDPTFVQARRPRRVVDQVLISMGGSSRFFEVGVTLAALVAEVFPGARLVAPRALADAAPSGAITALSSPADLVTAARSADLAVVAAGVSAYEMACAGVPTVAVALVDNQLPVIKGCAARGVALTVDGVAGDPVAGARGALRTLRYEEARRRIADNGMAVVDGSGADRTAERLLEFWRGG